MAAVAKIAVGRVASRGFVATLAVIAAVAIACSASASASAVRPWWHLDTSVRPGHLAPNGEGTIVLQAENIGNGPTTGNVKVSTVVPAGFSIQSVSFFAYSVAETDLGPNGPLSFLELCHVVTQTVTCATEEIVSLSAFEDVEVLITVKAESGAGSGGTATASVEGGGTQPVSSDQQLSVAAAPVPFGVERFELVPEEEGGGVDVQAGSHPYQLTATLNLNQTGDPASPPALARDLAFELPPGLLGNALALPKCSDLDFTHVLNGGTVNLCPESTAIGVATVVIDEPTHLGLKTYAIPLFNLEPSKGEPARFGFEYAKSPVILDTSVRTGADYGVTVEVNNITTLTNVIASTVTFWGVPGDSSHDEARGWACIGREVFAPGSGQKCTTTNENQPAPFLTLPSSCEQPWTPTVAGDSWPLKAGPESEPASVSLAPLPYRLKDGFGRELGISGCDRLPFGPEITSVPDIANASTASGLTTTVRVPQEASENAAGLVSSSIEDITVALPAGVSVNPASANGLEACSEADIGYLPLASSPPEELQFTPTLPSPFCPDASKIGTVKITVPILKDPLEGFVYLATPAPNGEAGKNPFNSLVAIYILASDPESGVLVKLPGKVTLSDSGQATATFTNTPQAPIESAEIHLFGGARAPLSTPAHCGTYTTTASFAPWSGGESVSAQSQFAIAAGPDGTSCPSSLPFAPSIAAGTTNDNAAAFSPLTTAIAREDGSQHLQSVQIHTPPGLSGILSGIPLCPEAQANAGSCGQGSLIGHTSASVGVGSEPYLVTGGQVFLTEGYEGAPFGLSIVVPAKAGPFDLGLVVVRAKIEVDPLTAQLTVSTDLIPHILKGIPLEIRRIDVAIDRPSFTFNPSSCRALAIGGTIGAVEGAVSPFALPFQLTNCAALKFAPKFTVSTSGKTSKKLGASLVARLSYPKAAQGTQTNIARVKVDLPKQLPSRLTTLQKACPAKVFAANPDNCPKDSMIGSATVTTPVLPVPLKGPAIFVSHGGEAFPSLTIVLQGAPPYDVKIDLVGTTFISKTGITSTTFKTVPDVPFDTFQLTLPEGKFSALTANLPAKAKRSFCAQKLAMPSEFVAQNGAVIHQSTPIAVTGCPRHARKHHASAKQGKGKKR